MAKKRVTCPVCRGARQVSCEDYVMTYGTYDHRDVCFAGPCPACQGRGKVPCPECRGTGYVYDEEM